MWSIVGAYVLKSLTQTLADYAAHGRLRLFLLDLAQLREVVDLFSYFKQWSSMRGKYWRHPYFRTHAGFFTFMATFPSLVIQIYVSVLEKEIAQISRWHLICLAATSATAVWDVFNFLHFISLKRGTYVLLMIKAILTTAMRLFLAAYIVRLLGMAAYVWLGVSYILGVVIVRYVAADSVEAQKDDPLQYRPVHMLFTHIVALHSIFISFPWATNHGVLDWWHGYVILEVKLGLEAGLALAAIMLFDTRKRGAIFYAIVFFAFCFQVAHFIMVYFVSMSVTYQLRKRLMYTSSKIISMFAFFGTHWQEEISGEAQPDAGVVPDEDLTERQREVRESIKLTAASVSEGHWQAGVRRASLEGQQGAASAAAASAAAGGVGGGGGSRGDAEYNGYAGAADALAHHHHYDASSAAAAAAAGGHAGGDMHVGSGSVLHADPASLTPRMGPRGSIAGGAGDHPPSAVVTLQQHTSRNYGLRTNLRTPGGAPLRPFVSPQPRGSIVGDVAAPAAGAASAPPDYRSSVSSVPPPPPPLQGMPPPDQDLGGEVHEGGEHEEHSEGEGVGAGDGSGPYPRGGSGHRYSVVSGKPVPTIALPASPGLPRSRPPSLAQSGSFSGGHDGAPGDENEPVAALDFEQVPPHAPQPPPLPQGYAPDAGAGGASGAAPHETIDEYEDAGGALPADAAAPSAAEDEAARLARLQQEAQLAVLRAAMPRDSYDEYADFR